MEESGVGEVEKDRSRLRRDRLRPGRGEGEEIGVAFCWWECA